MSRLAHLFAGITLLLLVSHGSHARLVNRFAHTVYAELTEADTAEDWSEIPSVYATLPEEGDSSHQQDETPSKAPELAFDSEANIVPTCVCSHRPAV